MIHIGTKIAAAKEAARLNRRWGTVEKWAVRTPDGWTVVASREPPSPGRYGAIEILERA